LKRLGIPVVLLYGSVPAWRALDEGETGADVSQLNHDLVALGDADGADISALGWDYFSWQTQVGVERLQSAVGVGAPAGSLPLGRVVFESAVIRVSGVPGSLGTPAEGTVLTATSDQQVVMITLSTSQESEVAVGDPVTVTLPDGAAAMGTVSAVGAVASGAAGNATIPVTVTLTRPSGAGTLDQAPVTVDITTATVKNALAVPVTALVARAPGGYVVEVVGPGNSRRWVPVTTGVFDDGSGLVQVTGALSPGQRVVVPAS
jgi:multidrug efflux pump subunit AcrA (membrane-fusion protein)